MLAFFDRHVRHQPSTHPRTTPTARGYAEGPARPSERTTAPLVQMGLVLTLLVAVSCGCAAQQATEAAPGPDGEQRLDTASDEVEPNDKWRDVPTWGGGGAPDQQPSDRPAPRPAEPSDVGTSLEPPTLRDPVTLAVEPDADAGGVLSLDDDTDYVIEMPSQPVRRGLVLRGGRNIVLIGGEIAIPWQGSRPSIADRTGLKIRDATGTVHVEGLLLHGEDISEGIQIDAPEAVVQLQNVGVFGIHARDQAGFSDNHPDVIQTYGGVRELHVDGLTASSDYQGLMFKVDIGAQPHGPITLRHVNIVGAPTARYLMWFGTEPGFGEVTLHEVWLDVPAGRDGSLRRAVWPSPSGSYPDRAQVGRRADGIQYARWPSSMEPTVNGRVYQGRPPSGDFVNPDEIGIGYRRSR